MRYRWKGGKQLILNASPFLNLKLEVNEGKKKKKKPKGKASQQLHTLYLLHILFLFYGCAALNI